jgi:hypothetical protein
VAVAALKRPVTLHESHPITFAWVKNTAIVLASVIGAISATYGVVKVWLDERYINVEEAEALRQQMIERGDARYIDLNAKIASTADSVSRLAQAAKEHNDTDTRSAAGVTMQLLENKLTASVSRVNACNIARQGKHMTPLEQNVCFQYDADYAEAKRRYENAQNEASQTWRKR